MEYTTTTQSITDSHLSYFIKKRLRKNLIDYFSTLTTYSKSSEGGLKATLLSFHYLGDLAIVAVRKKHVIIVYVKVHILIYLRRSM